MPDSGFPSPVHPYQWSNGLIAPRYLGIGAGVLLSCGALVGVGLGWHFSEMLLRPVAAVEAQVLWTTGPAPSLPFDEVMVPGPLGDYPAWSVPAGPADTWVIAVHGRGADRREVLRMLPTLHRLGLPVLAISYRNDAGAPPSPDRRYHLGDTEWTDLAAAVRYALGHGARRVVLYGWSMGAALTGAFLDRADEAAHVAGVIWDSPVLDWRATLRVQAVVHRMPAALTSVVTRCATARTGIDFDRFDLVRHPPKVRPPTLLLHGESDSAVPPGPGRALAAAAPRLHWPLRHVELPGAEHTAGWNTDPAGYEAEVTRFLAGIGAAEPGRDGARQSG